MAFLDELSKVSALQAIGTALVLYSIYGGILVVYRLYFSPLARFPGPKLAALTLWYEFYYDVYCGGQYVFKIAKLHEKYGPIIRISPHELHVMQPLFYEELFAGASEKRNKYAWAHKLLATPQAALGTVDHDLHRYRRNAMNSFFSKASARRLQPMIQERVDKFLERMRGFRDSGEVMTISLAYTAIASDIVTAYALGRNYQRLDKPDFDRAHAQGIHDAVSIAHFNKQIYWPFHTLISLPPWIQLKIAPALSEYIGFIRDLKAQIYAMKSSQKESKVNDDGVHATILEELLLTPLLPDGEKGVERLVQEAQVIVSAGTETTSWAMSVTTYHLMANPHILQKVRAELAAAFPDPQEEIPVAQLEQLPYLTACIEEGLRLSYGASSRLQRVSPEKPLLLHDSDRGKTWEIPPGVPTSMTTYHVHHDETIFPDSFSYVPERWLNDPHLTRYLCSFTKGTRQCVGINVAYAEIYLLLSAIFRRFGTEEDKGVEGYLQLFETTTEDTEMAADVFVPFAKKGSKGIRIFVKRS